MKPTKSELFNFLEDHSREEASKFYNITSRTLRRWLQGYGLSRFDNRGAGKLDAIAAKKIRALYASDRFTQQRLAEIFSVSQPMIGRIVNNEAYQSDVCLGGSAEVVSNNK